MTAFYEPGNVPFISGGTLNAKYSFKAIRFVCHRRMTNANVHQPTPTKHTVNGHHYAMEMQLLAKKELTEIPDNKHHLQQRYNEYIIVSYFFVEQKSRNYCFEPLLKCLKYIRRPNTMKTLAKQIFPLNRIVYHSDSRFYGYIRQWHECRIQYFVEVNNLIPIGAAQMSEFHKLAMLHIDDDRAADNSLIARVRLENRLNPIELIQFISRPVSTRKAPKIENA